MRIPVRLVLDIPEPLDPKPLNPQQEVGRRIFHFQTPPPKILNP